MILGTAGQRLRIIDLPARLGVRLAKMPVIHRLVAENLLRAGGDDGAAAFAAWIDGGQRDVELPFHPGRIMMHDTTCVPALVDLAAARDVLAAKGGDPARIDGGQEAPDAGRVRPCRLKLLMVLVHRSVSR